MTAPVIAGAHRAGTVHRDIKPSNVLVTSHHEPALTDFGIAGRLQEVAAEEKVRISYPWSPPEMLDGRSNGSVASDLYSLGATIWHLLVGRSPFSITGGDNSARALSARILHAAPPATQRPDVPPPLDRLLQQTMAKQPGHRPPERAGPGACSPAHRGSGRVPAHPDRRRGRPGAGQRAAHGRLDRRPDVTQVKPVHVVSASGPRTLGAAPPADGPAAGTWLRSMPLWAAIVIAVTFAVFVALVFTEEPLLPDTPVGPGPTASSTPADLAPDAPSGPPRLDARRTAQGVLFSWASVDQPQLEDSWEWQRPASGESERTSDTRLLVRDPGSDDEVCVQVRLIRGSFASQFAQTCADPADER